MISDIDISVKSLPNLQINLGYNWTLFFCGWRFFLQVCQAGCTGAIKRTLMQLMDSMKSLMLQKTLNSRKGWESTGENRKKSFMKFVPRILPLQPGNSIHLAVGICCGCFLIHLHILSTFSGKHGNSQTRSFTIIIIKSRKLLKILDKLLNSIIILHSLSISEDR